MRKFVISLAAAGAAFAVASPAAAQQYYPAPQQYGYGNSHSYNGYNGFDRYGQVRALQARVDRVEHQLRRLDRRDRIRDHSAERLRGEARRIEERLHVAARNGLNPYEANDIARRIATLEQRVQYAVSARSGRYGNGNGYGSNGYYADRDDRHDRDHDRDYRGYDDRDDDQRRAE